MKNLCTICCIVLGSLGLYGQDQEVPDQLSEIRIIERIINNLSFVGSLGGPSFDLNPSEYNLEGQSGSLSLGELGIAYKLNGKISVGVSILGSLGNCNSGYFDTEGNFVSFSAEIEDEDDMDGDEIDDDECDDDLLDNIAGIVRIKFAESIPIFLEVTGGYSMSADAPAISAMIAYNQKVLSDLGVYFGIRYGDVFHKIPKDVIEVTSSSGLKAELGVTWNF